MSCPTISRRDKPLLVRVRTSLLLFVFLLFLLAVPPTVKPQINPSTSRQAEATVASIQSLELAKPIEGQITGGEVHAYNLALKVDEYAHLDLDQRGIDLAVWTFDPTGKKISELDAFRVGEKEAVAIVAEMSGLYRIEVHTTFPKVPTGRYEINVPELRPATERDKGSYRGGLLIAQAFELEVKQNQESWRKAIEKYEAALSIWQSIK